jgi:protein O-GlcNAc transferase
VRADELNVKGLLEARTGQFEHAKSLIGRALELQPTNIQFRENYADAHINLGNAFGALGRDDEAAAAFSRGLALSPQSAPAWVGLGNVLRKRRAFDDALAAFDKALALQPDLSAGWLGRANVYFHRRQYDDALTAYDRALRSQSNLAEALWGRGHVLHALKRHADAASSIAALLNVDPEYPFAEGMLLHENMMMCDSRDVAALTEAQ